MHRITITIDDDLMGDLDRVIETRGYQNRSERQLLAGRLCRVVRQHCVELLCPTPELRSRLNITLVFEGSLAWAPIPFGVVSV